MALSAETKHKIVKALPWVIGGAVVLFVVVKMMSGKRSGGSAPVQDLSSLGGGGGGGLIQQPQAVPQQIAQSFADQLGQSSMSRSELFRSMLQNNAAANNPFGATPAGRQGGHQTYTYEGGGAISKAWQQVQGGWEDIFHPGHIITEQQAQQLSSQDSGPYARGKGGFFKQVFGGAGNFINGLLTSASALRGADEPVTLGNVFLGARGYAQDQTVYAPRQIPSANGAARPQPGPSRMPQFTPGIAPGTGYGEA